MDLILLFFMFNTCDRFPPLRTRCNGKSRPRFSIVFASIQSKPKAALKNVIKVALPLVTVPPLHSVRERLIFEFPYAIDVIDFALADLVGRTAILLRPPLLVRGGGKSRFARRLGEVLGLSVLRTDASRADGTVFADTDRRWYSAEPCHPFLAIGQARHANPMVLLDEIARTGPWRPGFPVRRDRESRRPLRRWPAVGLHSRIPRAADKCALPRYPDPALQVTVDFSHVSYVATANSFDPLPSPVRDRFRVITFPKPRRTTSTRCCPLSSPTRRERNLDRRWIKPLDGLERAAVAMHWRGVLSPQGRMFRAAAFRVFGTFPSVWRLLMDRCRRRALDNATYRVGNKFAHLLSRRWGRLRS